MSFSEPTTMATDYVLVVLCGFFAWRLWKVGKGTAQVSVCSWAAGFVCFGLASLAGGTVHGFSTLLSETALQSLWKVTIYVVGLASFFLLTGTFSACIMPSVRRFAMLIPYVQLIVYALWMATHDDFRYVIYDYALTNLCILALQCHAGISRRAVSAPWLIGGVLVSFLAAGVQFNEIALHQHFNHNDLYHVIQMGGMYLFYRGALLLKDR
ncbi:MAG: hypothetical protein E8D41_07445 [Nitrospira sp.]|nr:MAG: hypothetical protein E8D41_07445 [Nitrospira sp.]